MEEPPEKGGDILN
ncbi:hypothetical protein CL3_26870 [butyrate-producing bacterium SM4/1]|nr:hypothetical protein CLS_24190 [[Clostridium] cf. saccharolyticum K10]CBL36733.1 hypothetical protein CL3_26870 [butyrate-producing bacterium SM4/1]